MTDTTNITKLARAYRLSTTDTEKRLRKSGLSPANEVVMPSGRRFVLWPREESVKALEEYQRSLQDSPRKDEKPPQSLDLSQDIAEVKKLLQQLLEHVTKP